MTNGKNNQTFEQMLARQNCVKPRKHPAEEEHRIQCACVRLFRYKHPDLQRNLFAVPNGGRRDKVTGAKMKAEGVVPGVSDLILLVPNNYFHGLCIEMKDEKGIQRETQREWQKAVEAEGYKYVLCRSLDDFERETEDYISSR